MFHVGLQHDAAECDNHYYWSVKRVSDSFLEPLIIISALIV